MGAGDLRQVPAPLQGASPGWGHQPCHSLLQEMTAWQLHSP